MLVQSQERSRLLRAALLANAAFSTLSGLIILFAPAWVARVLGLSGDVNLMILGIGLIAFAAILVTNARRQQVKRSEAWIAVSLDLAWVLGSYTIIFLVPFSPAGTWIVALVAELVLLFAVLQFMGIRRLQRSLQ